MNKDLPKGKTYLPSAGKDWLLPLYDPLTSLFGLDVYYYGLLEIVRLFPSQSILDVGCGTGSLGKIIKQTIPAVEFAGIDPDPRALAVARHKLKRYSNVNLDVGFGHRLPYANSYFDHVVSTFVFHHLDPDEQIDMISEVRRVLKNDSTFLSIDFDRSNKSKELPNHSIPEILLQAGFQSVTVERERHFLFGSISLYSAN